MLGGNLTRVSASLHGEISIQYCANVVCDKKQTEILSIICLRFASSSPSHCHVLREITNARGYEKT